MAPLPQHAAKGDDGGGGTPQGGAGPVEQLGGWDSQGARLGLFTQSLQDEGQNLPSRVSELLMDTVCWDLPLLLFLNWAVCCVILSLSITEC